MSLQQIPGHYIISSSATATGGGSTLYNTAITATSTASATGAYTATQVPVSAKDNVTASPTGTTSQFVQYGPTFYAQVFDWSAVSALDTLVVDIPMNYDVGQYTAFIGTGTDFNQARYTYEVTNGYLQIKASAYDPGVSTTVDRELWSGLEPYNPSTVYVGFGSYSMHQEYTGVMDNRFTGQVTTSTSYPYPDRPLVDYFSATANATANEYLYVVGGGYEARANGTATNGSVSVPIQSTGVGCTITALDTALSNVLGTSRFNDYPWTAYAITGYTGGVTSGSTGLGL